MEGKEVTEINLGNGVLTAVRLKIKEPYVNTVLYLVNLFLTGIWLLNSETALFLYSS